MSRSPSNTVTLPENGASPVLEPQPVTTSTEGLQDEVKLEEPSLLMETEKKPSSARSYQIRLSVALALPVFLDTLDYTVVATAQPHIASAFNRLDLQSYIGTVYVLTSTVFLPIFASLADIFGRYWALQIAMFFFLLGSALSTAAQNIPMVLAGRGIAGVGAAGLLTVVRIILADSSSLNANNIQSAILVLLYAIGFSAGPSIGGALTSISFRWVFGINLPCLVASMILAFILLPGYVKPPQVRNQPTETEYKYTLLQTLQRLDVLGAFLFTVGGILILLGLNWGSTNSWNDAKVIATLVLGGVLALAFIVWEWFAERPSNNQGVDGDEKVESASYRKPSWRFPETIIPLDVFKNYDVCATQFAAFASGMVMLVNFYFLAIFFTIVLNKSPTQSGVQLIFFAPGLGIGTVISIFMIKYLRQPKIPIIFGTALIPIGLGLLSFGTHINKQSLVDVFLVVCGVGIGVSFGPLATHARFSQPESRVAVVFRTFGGTVGLAQCSAVMNAKVRTALINLARSGAFSPAELAQIASLGDITSIQAISDLSPALQQAVRDAFREGVRWAFISLIPWTAVSAILVLFLTKIRDTDLEKEYGPPPNTGTTVENGSAGTSSLTNGNNVSNSQEDKPKIYGPISLIIYLVRKQLKKRREARERAQQTDTAESPAVAQATVVGDA
ncbi:hypothetical protein Clacol_003205 [Clathrus columnatus]|uniref:Major facilitator superfamily (MFS) profile domain-containing protein n=1 Tax=Clathrus columnatus TaxID=1419009 RepID=A0AAV5A2U3_9AGAM|nr:hypothetical protein Clacol_003205 [Clathrus columnatus]